MASTAGAALVAAPTVALLIEGIMALLTKMSLMVGLFIIEIIDIIDIIDRIKIISITGIIEGSFLNISIFYIILKLLIEINEE